MKDKADIGFIGLGVMGANLVLNMDDHGFSVAIYNRTTEKVDEFLENHSGHPNVKGAYSLEELVGSLAKPRRIMLMIKAGKPVFSTIDQLIPLLDQGDIIIDGGNSAYLDSMRAAATLEAKGLLYVGCGVSGGEEGARHGPSLMPGGSPAAWPHVREIFQAIAAKVDNDIPCCDWVGENGAGHFVKMVHNGIEYGDMQLICEAYDLMRSLLGMDHDEMSDVFHQWNQGELSSYLIEITRDILAFRDSDGLPMVEKILDTAGQKGTGKLAVAAAMEAGIPLSLIGEAVFARFLSALKDERLQAAEKLRAPQHTFNNNGGRLIKDIGKALYAAKIVSYAQGYMLMRTMSKKYGWQLNYGGIALMWRGGCIIRADFLDHIKAAFEYDPQLTNLLLDPYFQNQVESAQNAWRRVVIKAVEAGIPVPALSSGLTFLDGYRQARLPSNLLQAQRDYFGAHTYERIDRPRGEFFHTNWTGHGGDITSSSYNG